MKVLDKISFTEDEKGFLCSIINNFGSDQHPVADEKSLPFFTVEYIKEILYTDKFDFINQKDNLSGLGVHLLKSIEEKIK